MQVFMMRTTLDIDDSVLLAAKEIARRKNSTAGAVISDLARKALTGVAMEPAGISEPHAFYGFQPQPASGRVVSNETIEKIREEEGI
jgi:hypothetical protein